MFFKSLFATKRKITVHKPKFKPVPSQNFQKPQGPADQPQKPSSEASMPNNTETHTKPQT